MDESRENLQRAFGRAVRQSRTDAGLSQEDLADRSGLHRTYVSQIERGLRSPSLVAISALAHALGTTAYELFRVVEQELDS